LAIHAFEDEAIGPFIDRGPVSDILYEVKSGKEATVYCCRLAGGGLAAAKVYRPREGRRFKDASVYLEGRAILDKRARRAVEAKTEFGRKAEFAMWLNHEYETLRQLWRIGMDVPEPIAIAERALLIGYVGDAEAAAPALHEVALHSEESWDVFGRVMRNIEGFLGANLIHGDLSAYNILYFEGEVKVIDFPQAVDPRFNVHARDLLNRDVERVCRYFRRHHPNIQPDAIANDLWWRWKQGEL
jgi:RIO kinase 1